MKLFKNLNFSQRNKVLALLVLLSSAQLFVFQNCAKTKFAQSSSVGGLGAGSLVINNDDRFTLSPNVFIHLYPDQTSPVLEYALFSDEDCSGEEKWNKIVDATSYKLSGADGDKPVFVKYKYKVLAEASGYKLGNCVGDYITLDTTKPVVRIKGPQSPSNSNVEDFTILVDDANGVASRSCSTNSVQNFKSCAEVIQVPGLVDGSHTLYAKAKDLAGNESEVSQYNLVIDTKPPVLTLLTKPANPTTNISADFTFSSIDQVPGTGIKSHSCQIDDGQWMDCSNLTFKGSLSFGSHVFKVFSTDFANNNSAIKEYPWVIEKPIVLGEFTVQGYSPQVAGAIVRPYWLVGSLLPRVYHSRSINATRYSYRIIDTSNTQVCTASSNVADPQFIDFTNCTLKDTAIYMVIVKADGNNLDGTPAQSLEKSGTFRVDFSNPLAQALSVNLAQAPLFGDNAVFSFAASDISGIKSIKCIDQASGAQPLEVECTELKQKSLSGLAVGTHQFRIEATDNNGQVGVSNTVSYLIKPNCTIDEVWMGGRCQKVICDPLKGHDQLGKACEYGFIGNIYYINKTNYEAFTQDFIWNQLNPNYFIVNGTKAASLINLSTINVPNRNFTEGFSGNGVEPLKNAQGETLIEYFGLDLFAGIKSSSSAENGKYMLLTASDDGTTIEMGLNDIFQVDKNPKNYNYSMILGNGKTQSVKVGCSSLVDINETPKPIRVKYFQSLASEIAFSVYWKKIQTKEEEDDAKLLCGQNDRATIYQNILNKGFVIVPNKNVVTPTAF